MKVKELVLQIQHRIWFDTVMPQPYPDYPRQPDTQVKCVVRLKNDPTKKEYEALRTGPISRGPVGQFSPSVSIMVRSWMHGYEGEYYEYHWFRKDSLEFVR